MVSILSAAYLDAGIPHKTLKKNFCLDFQKFTLAANFLMNQHDSIVGWIA